MSESDFVAAYLSRLGLERPGRADAEALRVLHRAHLLHVPFENLDIHLGIPLSLDPGELAAKLLRRRRGGFCYELNGSFARLVVALGYRVALLGARVWDGEALGPPLDHLVLRVECADGSAWLADVGFGEHTLHPLRLEPLELQHDPNGAFQIVPCDDGDLDVLRDGVAQYRVEDHPRELRDFDAMCWYQESSPRSHFTRSLVCTIQREDGRVTLSDRRLITTAGLTRTEEVLEDRAVLACYAEVFGIELDRIPPSPAQASRSPDA